MMKKLLVFASLAISIPVFSQVVYECVSADGEDALLTVQSDNKTIYWQDLYHAASTKGIFHGIEKAPYSTEKGFLTYLATDFAISEDSFWYIKIDPDYKKKQSFRIVEGYDNDGHNESETTFKCHL